MKKNIFKILGLVPAVLGSFMLFSCTAEDEGPSIDDFYLNYEIEKVNVTQDVTVGAFYVNVGSGGISEEIYERVIAPYNPEKVGDTDPQIGPNVRPVLGRYSMNQNTDEACELFQQHIDWAQEAGINYFVLPNLRYDANVQNRVQENSLKFYTFMEGYAERSEGKINWGKLQLVPSVLMTDFNKNGNELSKDKCIEEVDLDDNGHSKRIDELKAYFVGIAQRFGNDSLAYKVNGKLMLVLWNCQQLYSRDSKALYDGIRDSVREATGVELYLVARQPNWSPSARYYDFFLTGGVDAVYLDNMYNQTDFSRKEMYPVMINENYKYNKQYLMANHNIDFIPNISPSFNRWVQGGSSSNLAFYRYPPMYKDEDRFRTMCNVAKLNLGNNRMVLIDSFNDWSYDTALEPSDPYYGNGYGMKYLEIVKDEFKVK